MTDKTINIVKLPTLLQAIDLDEAIAVTKEALDKYSANHPSRELSIAKTNLDTCAMWFEAYLKTVTVITA